MYDFFFTMLFSGGLIPGYLLIQNLKMMDTIWALVLPAAVPVYNVILMLNFFRGIPHELEEAAEIDGAGQWRIVFPDLCTMCKAVNRDSDAVFLY